VFVVVTERGVARRLELHKDEITIGRVAGNDVVLPTDSVSEFHARVVRKDGQLVILDLKSDGGTFVNGRKLTGPVVLESSDQVYIGDFALSVGPHPF
jgi:pilus assembly protein CpaF